MKRRDVLKAGLAFAAAVAAPSIGRAQARVTMRLSHPLPTAHHTAKSIAAFAADVKAMTNGEIEVQIFPAEQAAKAAENHPSVARGGIEAAASVNFQWGNTVPEMNLTVIPFLIADLDKLKRWFDSPIAQILEAKLEQRGVKNLMWLYTTRQTIFTGSKPIRTPEDFKRLKIRGLNKLADQGLIALGAAPSAMAAPEVYQALQSGVLDAAQTDVSAAVSRRFYEVQKFGTVSPQFSVWYHVYVNPAWWNGLSVAHKDALKKAARKTELESFDLTEATAAAAVGTLREKGMTIHIQTPEETAAWKAIMQKPVMDEFLRLAPQDGPKLIDAVARL
jgi:TRAP-type C4-dicarboxylate transport system substrate-binding protein